MTQFWRKQLYIQYYRR